MPDTLCNLKKLRQCRALNQRLRREHASLTDELARRDWIQDALDALPDAMMRRDKAHAGYTKQTSNATTQTHEWLLSDLHLGKRIRGYNTATAKQRLAHYADAIVARQAADAPHYTTLAILGDLVEGARKHEDSHNGCDCDTPQQLAEAIAAVDAFINAIYPQSGQHLRIVCIAGNHERDAKGSAQNFQGLTHWSYTIYKVLAHMWRAHERIRFEIAEGAYATALLHPCGRKAVYEHGSKVMVSESAMTTRRAKRSEQCGRLLHCYRQGDKHNVSVFDSGKLVCNGAFFSDSNALEYSGVAGYASAPAQVGFSHGYNSIASIHLVGLRG